MELQFLKKYFKMNSLRNKTTIGFLFVGIIFVVVGCNGADKQVDAAASEKIAQEIRIFTAHNTKAGEQRWTLEADVARYMESRRIDVENPRVTIFKDGKKSMTITGESGEIDQDSADLRILGNPVEGVGENGIIYTNELYWKDAIEKLYAPGAVKIIRGDSVMTGEKMEADPGLEVVNLKKVHFEIYPKDEKINEAEKE